MKTSEVAEAIFEVSSQVLEDMAFVFVEPADEGSAWENDLITGELSFSGEYQGQLIITMGSSLSMELAANLLGVEPDDPEAGEKRFDAIGELANVIGGILMQKVFGENQNHTLGIPEVRAVSPDELSVQGQAFACVSLMDDEERRIDIAMKWGK